MVKRRRTGLLVFGLIACLSVVFVGGCTTTTTSDDNPNNTTVPADPPSGTTGVNVSGGSISGSGNSLSFNFLATDQDSNTLTNITRGNLTATVYDANPGAVSTAVENYDVTALATISVTISHLSSGANTAKPIAVGMTLDKSGSMFNYPDNSKVSTLEVAAAMFVDLMSADSQAAIINFDNTVSIEAAMTTDKNVLKKAITVEAPYQGSTAIYSATYTAIGETAAVNSADYVRGVITMTDGQNNSGIYTESDVTNEAIAQGLPVYTVGLFETSSEAASYRAPLVRIAEATTGTSESYHEVIVGVTGLSVMSADDIRALGALTDIYTQLAQALTDAYTTTCTLSSTLVAGQQYWVVLRLHTYGTFDQSIVLTFIAK